MKKVSLYYYTIKHLTWEQIFYRLYYHVFGKIIRLKRFGRDVKIPATQLLNFQRIVTPKLSDESNVNNLKFVFNNKEKRFKQFVDWNFLDYGMLWCYNLNYFDFIWDKNLVKSDAVRIVTNYIDQLKPKDIGLDPYCISLRVQNWIKYFSFQGIKDPLIDEGIYQQLTVLEGTLEYHLNGNHLFENALCLLFGAYYFKNEVLYRRASNLIKDVLNTQILEDGAHYELSPMYHQILLVRLLDTINLVKNNSQFNSLELHELLTDKTTSMLSWLNQITFNDGSIPYVNDSAPGIAPETEQINKYAEFLGIGHDGNARLGDSGYRKITFFNKARQQVELFIDVGAIQANSQPGHTHSDIFNFILYFQELPLIIDTGTSEYAYTARRMHERSTVSHNTVDYDGNDPLQVWATFRVARRTHTEILVDLPNEIVARHYGYKRFGFIHERRWSISKGLIWIEDLMIGSKNELFSLQLHFHPSVKLARESDTKLNANNLQISTSSSFDLETFQYAAGFNKIHESKKLTSQFREYSKVIIDFNSARRLTHTKSTG